MSIRCGSTLSVDKGHWPRLMLFFTLNDGAGSGRHFHPGSLSMERTSYIILYWELKPGSSKAVIEPVLKGYPSITATHT